jgi:hypothetical protein
MLAKLNKLKNWQVALFIVILGFAVFSVGLNSPFRDDDLSQIVNAVPVHSISSIKLFFEGGTFYNGQGMAPLTGVFYRPLQTTIYSLIYAIAGAYSLTFHLLQLILYISSAYILYLVFRYSFNKILALFLAAVFLVQPINSQVVFAIPQLTDVLFFFFGILAIWLLLRFKLTKSLWLVALCLFLSLLAKETAVIFIIIALLYLFWFNRDRLYKFIGIMVLPVTAYLMLRINAVGLVSKSLNAPIDKLDWGGRLLTAPSIMQFYLTKFIFPWKLATSYFWTNQTFSLRHVLLPLMIDLAVIALAIYLALVIRKKVSKELYYTYLFFAVWAFIGLIPYLQIIPIDMTACETWFYLSMAGFLGMIGVILVTFQSHISPKWFLIIAVLLIGMLGVRSTIRGNDWRNPISLAYKDIAASPDNFIAYKNIALDNFNQGNYYEAKIYSLRSIDIFPNGAAYNTLGQALSVLGNYPGAVQAFTTGMRYQNLNALYENRAALTAGYGSPATNTQFLLTAVKMFPQDSKIWFYLAIQEYRDSDPNHAKAAISQAYKYWQPNDTISFNTVSAIYSRIMSNAPLDVTFNPNP